VAAGVHAAESPSTASVSWRYAVLTGEPTMALILPEHAFAINVMKTENP
jgi:hypothetical protein